MITPRYYSIVSGSANSKHALVAFDKALQSAGIGDYNLVKVSSIIPAGCIYQESVNIPKGSILFTAYANKTVSGTQTGSAAVAVAIPVCSEENGVIFETTSDQTDAESVAVGMCKEAMANRGRAIKEVRTSSIVINSTSDNYTCGVSAVVMW